MTERHHLYTNQGPNQKHVMFCPVSRLYVGYDCVLRTTRRDYAWVGTRDQSKRAREVYNVGASFLTFRDGEERSAYSPPRYEQPTLSAS